jgi:Transposase, Mutator family
VAPRVSPTETIRAEIHELFASGGELLSVIEQVARLSVRLTFQSVIEEIVCEELGRDRYERRGADSPEGYRNGWQQPRTIKSALGPVQVQRPKLRHAHAAVCERLFGQASAGPTRWRPWSSPAGCGACRTATWRPRWSRSSARTPRSAGRR